MGSRLLSYTEVSTALSCPAKWDFSYGGHLLRGETLRQRETAPILSDGRAWGAGIAAWHQSYGELLGEYAALTAMWGSINDDMDEMRRKGFEPDPERAVEAHERLGLIFGHHAATVEQLPGLTMLEGELNVPIPSRGGKRGSNRYRFHCYLDGHTEAGGHPWIVEFKLRKGLTPRGIMERQPQYRWYALAYALTHDVSGPVGVYVDETLNAEPKPARVLKSGKPSHAADQFTTAERYVALCEEKGEEPKDTTLEALSTRQWHQRVPLLFTPDDLETAARELTSAARIIRDLDTGVVFPIRNGSRSTCQSCRFVGICNDTTNGYLIDSLFERTQPKRLRGPRPEGVR